MVHKRQAAFHLVFSQVLAYRGQTGSSQLCHYMLQMYSISDVNLMMRVVTTDSQVFVHGALEALL